MKIFSLITNIIFFDKFTTIWFLIFFIFDFTTVDKDWLLKGLLCNAKLTQGISQPYISQLLKSIKKQFPKDLPAVKKGEEEKELCLFWKN